MKHFSSSLKSKLALLVAALTLVASAAAHSEQFEKFGEWQIHYNAIPSTFLAPAIASQYGVTRSGYQGLLNIAIVHQDTGAATTANVTGQVLNPLGQPQKLAFKEIKENDAIYYLAQFSHTNQEMLRFTIDIEKDGKTHQLTFNQAFDVFDEED